MRLLLFDTHTGEARVLRSRRRPKKVTRMSLVARDDGSFLLVAFRGGHEEWTARRLAIGEDGELSCSGKLKSDGSYLDEPINSDRGVVLPLLDGGAHRMLTITDAMLGSRSAGCKPL